MTDDETTLIKGETVEKLSALRQRHTCLTTKAEKYLSAVSRGQEFLSAILGENGVSMEGPQLPAELVWPSHKDLLGIHDDLKTTHDQIGNLHEKLRSWGAV